MFSYSILPALSLDGILHCVIIEGAFTSVTFNDFIRGLAGNDMIDVAGGTRLATINTDPVWVLGLRRLAD